jgi:hypothetical protein
MSFLVALSCTCTCSSLLRCAHARADRFAHVATPISAWLVCSFQLTVRSVRSVRRHQLGRVQCLMLGDNGEDTVTVTGLWGRRKQRREKSKTWLDSWNMENSEHCSTVYYNITISDFIFECCELMIWVAEHCGTKTGEVMCPTRRRTLTTK